MNSDHKFKICPTGPWSTIVVLMLHDSSSESCDDGHFIASTALGGHRQGMARLLSWNAPLLRREIPTGPMASAKSRPTASCKKGMLLCGVKRLLGIRARPLNEFQAAQDPKPGSWQQVKDVISIFRVQSLTLKQILGLSTLRKPFPISTFRKYIGALTLNSSLALLVM